MGLLLTCSTVTGVAARARSIRRTVCEQPGADRLMRPAHSRGAARPLRDGGAPLARHFVTAPAPRTADAVTECRPGGFTADDTDPPGAGRLQSLRPAPRSGALMSPVRGVPSASPERGYTAPFGLATGGSRSVTFVGTAPPSNTFFPTPSTMGCTQRSSRSKSFSRRRVCTRFKLPTTFTCSCRSRISRTAPARSGPSCVDPAHERSALPREATYFGTLLNSVAISLSSPPSWYGQ